MFAQERQEQILEMLRQNKRVSNTELIKKFGVSGTTIRIDLTELEQKGLLKRTPRRGNFERRSGIWRRFHLIPQRKK